MKVLSKLFDIEWDFEHRFKFLANFKTILVGGLIKPVHDKLLFVFVFLGGIQEVVYLFGACSVHVFQLNMNRNYRCIYV